MKILSDDTLAPEEMPDFKAPAYIVGPNRHGLMAHIYIANTTLSLCGNNIRIRLRNLQPYTAGDRTCKRCIASYRRRMRE